MGLNRKDDGNFEFEFRIRPSLSSSLFLFLRSLGSMQENKRFTSGLCNLTFKSIVRIALYAIEAG